MHNRRLCEQELESIVVNLESGLKARFLPWLQPGSPEEADRRDKRARGAHSFNVAHERLPWHTRAPELLDCALFLLKAPPRTPRQPVVGHIKKVCPSGRLISYRPSYLLSRLSASSGGPGCSQGKKRVFKTGSNLTTIASSSCPNNLRFCSYG